MTSRLGTARVAVGVLLLLAPASPARAFDYDTHYLWTYYLALQVGYTPRQAYQIASATFAVDHDKETGPLEATAFEAISNAPLPETETVWTRFHAFADARYAAAKELTPSAAIEYHARIEAALEQDRLRQNKATNADWRNIRAAALEGDPAMIRQIREQNRSALWELAIETGNPGLYLHYIQDIYSHWDYDSRQGHLYSSHAPDFLSFNVARSRDMTTDTLQALQDFARAKGFATRPVDMTRVWEVLDRLVAANPPVWGDSWRYYDMLIQKGIDVFGVLATTFGRQQEAAGVVPAGTATATKVLFALMPKISGAGSPDGDAAWRIVTTAVADDLRRSRLPSFPELLIENVPDRWFQYDYDAGGRVADPAFAVEWPEVLVGDAKLECAPEPDTPDQMRVTLRIPYEIRGAATLPFQHPLPVYHGSIVSDSAARRDIIERRVNGQYEHVRNLRAPRARLDGSNRWTETIAVGHGNEHAIVVAPLQCGQGAIPAQPPRLASPPLAPIACPASSLGSGSWTISAYGNVQNGLLCYSDRCVVGCQYGQGPGSRVVGITWFHKDASTCRDFLGPRVWSLTRDLSPRGAAEPETAAEARDPEGKRLLDQLEAAVAPYAWKCPSAGSATAAITKSSWLRPVPATSVASLLSLAGGGGGRSVIAILAGAEVLRPPAPGPTRIMFDGRTVDAVYEQNVDSSGKPIDIYFYKTVPPPGAPAPVGDQVWSKFVRAPAVAANSTEPVIWWHSRWEYRAGGWQYVQERGVPPPQTPR